MTRNLFSTKPQIFKDRKDGSWRLWICDDEWKCYLGWLGAMGFLRALYLSGDVGRIQSRAEYRWETQED